VKYPAKASEAEMILAEAFISKRLRLSPCFSELRTHKALPITTNNT
jgi:hypothetical protein